MLKVWQIAIFADSFHRVDADVLALRRELFCLFWSLELGMKGKCIPNAESLATITHLIGHTRERAPPYRHLLLIDKLCKSLRSPNERHRSHHSVLVNRWFMSQLHLIGDLGHVMLMCFMFQNMQRADSAGGATPKYWQSIGVKDDCAAHFTLHVITNFPRWRLLLFSALASFYFRHKRATVFVSCYTSTKPNVQLWQLTNYL